jgi:ribosomal protein S18 acetylase RimI-like enzyme
MYVAPTHRNKGIANLLVKTVIDHAKKCVLQLHATVVTSNQSALNLYEKNGFVIYGTEPRSLKIDSHFFDEHMMVLTF